MGQAILKREFVRTIASTAFLACLCSMIIAAQEADRGAQIYSKAAPSVVLLVARSGDNQTIAQASGFLTAGGKIVTNAHVANVGRVFLELGAAKIPLTVEAIDNENDLATLVAQVELSIEPLPLAAKPPAPGESVYAIGNPRGLERSISAGVVSGIREMDSRQVLQVTSAISPGSSGGPVLNAKGEVVGVAVGSLKGGQNLNFAVPVGLLVRLLSGATTRPTGAAGFLREIGALEAQRLRLTAPSDTPAVKIIDSKIRRLLKAALEAAGNDAAVLVRVTEKARLIPDAEEIAVAAAQRAAQIGPSAKTHALLAECLNDRYLDVAPEDRPALLLRAEAAARAAIQASKEPSASLYLLLARILQSRESHSQAESYFKRAFDLSQANGADAEESLTGLFECAYAQGKMGDGDRWFDLLLKKGAAGSAAWHSRAWYLENARKYHEAGQAYQREAEIPAGGFGSRDRMRDGQILEMPAELTRAGHAPWCDAARMYYLADEDDSALSSARKCISSATDKKFSEGNLAETHRLVADLLNKRGVFEEALSHAKEAVVLSPSDPWAFHAQAEALMGLRRFQEAINASKQAIRVSDGKFASMHFTLGGAYFEIENWEFARQSFEKAAELEPKDDVAAYNVALCLSRLGYSHDAARWYEEVLRRNPNHKERREILQQIQNLRR